MMRGATPSANSASAYCAPAQLFSGQWPRAMLRVTLVIVVRHQVRRTLGRRWLIGAAQFIKQKFVG
jgi:hypothetical protein